MDLEYEPSAQRKQTITDAAYGKSEEIVSSPSFLLQGPTSIDPDRSNVQPSLEFSKNILRPNYTASTLDSDTSNSNVLDADLHNAVQPVPGIMKVPQPRIAALPRSSLPSGLIYDPRMRFHHDPVSVADSPHPENPRRITEIFQELVDAGLAADPAHPESQSDDQLFRLQARQATVEEIETVHSLKHIRFVQDLSGFTIVELKELDIEINNSVYFHNLTWLCASYSAGCAIEATEAVVDGRLKNVVAVIRPPGHHAEPPEPSNPLHQEPGGFCIFNNVSVAVRVVQQKWPDLCRKVLILDWDVHHGNGVQKAFYDDPNVLYISIHRYENATFYPHDKIGDFIACGTGPGLGRNVNIPWPCAKMGDADYLYAFQQVVMPIGIEFDPDLVVISAGFDAAEGDMLGECNVTPAGFSHMTHMLMQLAGGKVVACLEGGYNHRAIAKSFLAMTRTLMGEPPDRMGNLEPRLPTVRTVKDVIRVQSRFWKCLYPKDVSSQRQQDLGSERLHDVLREWASQKFFDEFEMSKLFILRQKLSKSLENQVLASPNLYEARPLLVVFHDPPEALGFPHPMTNELELHNTWLTDVSKTYVEWAIKNDFAVIDVNMPKLLTDVTDERGYIDPDPYRARRQAAKEVAQYLWTNYIEVGDSTHVFMMGVGDAHGGILELYAEYASALYSTDLTIGFIATTTLPKLSSSAEEGASNQYYLNSMIFVSNDHDVWDSQKLRRRHGKVAQSPANNLQDMLAVHKDQVTTELLRLTTDWRMGKSASPLQDAAYKQKLEDEIEDLSKDDMAIDNETLDPRESNTAADIFSEPPDVALSIETDPAQRLHNALEGITDVKPAIPNIAPLLSSNSPMRKMPRRSPYRSPYRSPGP